MRALRGARRTIARFRPVIAFEMCPAWLRRMNTSPAELLATLEDMGYSIHPLTDSRPGDAPRITSAAAFERWGPGRWTGLQAGVESVCWPLRVPRDCAIAATDKLRAISPATRGRPIF